MTRILGGRCSCQYLIVDARGETSIVLLCPEAWALKSMIGVGGAFQRMKSLAKNNLSLSAVPRGIPLGLEKAKTRNVGACILHRNDRVDLPSIPD